MADPEARNFEVKDDGTILIEVGGLSLSVVASTDDVIAGGTALLHKGSRSRGRSRFPFR